MLRIMLQNLMAVARSCHARRGSASRPTPSGHYVIMVVEIMAVMMRRWEGVRGQMTNFR